MCCLIAWRFRRCEHEQGVFIQSGGESALLVDELDAVCFAREFDKRVIAFTHSAPSLATGVPGPTCGTAGSNANLSD
jgi:hypothetical protein